MTTVQADVLISSKGGQKTIFCCALRDISCDWFLLVIYNILTLLPDVTAYTWYIQSPDIPTVISRFLSPGFDSVYTPRILNTLRS